ncbi:MAG: hypothetical protein HYV32_04475 [Candidatus Kerfeldbacteria bacterium]|nr:hypothetical protein [Candidatus Kerfeldbacteria bacterium]
MARAQQEAKNEQQREGKPEVAAELTREAVEGVYTTARKKASENAGRLMFEGERLIDDPHATPPEKQALGEINAQASAAEQSLQSRLEMLRKQVVEKEAQFQKPETSIMKSFFGDLMGDSKKKAEAKKEHAALKEQYEQAKAEMMAGDVEATIAEDIRLLDERAAMMMRGENPASAALGKMYKLHEKLGDINLGSYLEKQYGWKSDSRVVKMATRVVNLRMVVNLALLGGGLVLGATGFAGGAAAVMIGKRGLSGAATFFGTNDLLRGRRDLKTEKAVRTQVQDILHANLVQELNNDSIARGKQELITPTVTFTQEEERQKLLDARDQLQISTLLSGRKMEGDKLKLYSDVMRELQRHADRLQHAKEIYDSPIASFDEKNEARVIILTDAMADKDSEARSRYDTLFTEAAKKAKIDTAISAGLAAFVGFGGVAKVWHGMKEYAPGMARFAVDNAGKLNPFASNPAEAAAIHRPAVHHVSAPHHSSHLPPRPRLPRVHIERPRVEVNVHVEETHPHRPPIRPPHYEPRVYSQPYNQPGYVEPPRVQQLYVDRSAISASVPQEAPAPVHVVDAAAREVHLPKGAEIVGDGKGLSDALGWSDTKQHGAILKTLKETKFNFGGKEPAAGWIDSKHPQVWVKHPDEVAAMNDGGKLRVFDVKTGKEIDLQNADQVKKYFAIHDPAKPGVAAADAAEQTESGARRTFRMSERTILGNSASQAGLEPAGSYVTSGNVQPSEAVHSSAPAAADTATPAGGHVGEAGQPVHLASVQTESITNRAEAAFVDMHTKTQVMDNLSDHTIAAPTRIDALAKVLQVGQFTEMNGMQYTRLSDGTVQFRLNIHDSLKAVTPDNVGALGEFYDLNQNSQQAMIDQQEFQTKLNAVMKTLGYSRKV